MKSGALTQGPKQACDPRDTERGTRARVARLVLENGPSTVAFLSARLGLTPAAIRRHLDVLVAEGVVEARDAVVRGPRGRGRPAKRFALTDAGRGTFDHGYDDLALGALRYLRATGGDDAVQRFARERVADFERRYGAAVEGQPPERRVAVLADALSADGYVASTSSAPTVGEQLCQHHCPVAHVAAEFPELCEAETEAFGRLLGMPVQRLATIAHGDGVCTTHITSRVDTQVNQPTARGRGKTNSRTTRPTTGTAPTTVPSKTVTSGRTSA